MDRMTPNFTPEQKATIEQLVAQGWDREAAEMMVLETTPDIAEGEGPAEEQP
jgi:hypothetical protein